MNNNIMTVSFKIEAITRTDNLLLVMINDEKRRALRIIKNHVKIFGLLICLDCFGAIPIYTDSRQLKFNFNDDNF